MSVAAREHYCRVCGENKGHNFARCKNVSGMRQIILSQDATERDLLGRVKSSEQQDGKIKLLENSAHFHARIIQAMLDLHEAKR